MSGPSSGKCDVGQEGEGGGRAHTGDAAQQILLLPPQGAGLDSLVEVPVQVGPLLL